MTIDKIGIVFPSGVASKEKVAKGISLFENESIKLFEVQHQGEEYLAGNDFSRTESLISAIIDPQVSFLLAARGGYGSSRLDHSLIEDALKSNPKPLMGFSDISWLFPLWKSLNIDVYHGSVLIQLPNLIENHRKSTIELLLNGEVEFENEKLVPLNELPDVDFIKGDVICSNLSVLTTLIGTKYHPSFEGNILFIEDINEPPYKIDRMLNHLFQSSDLHKCKAVVLGDFIGCPKSHEIILGFFENKVNRNIPMFSGFPMGHGELNIPLKYGGVVTLFKGTKNWSVER
jgi:muramoyltetrapeptide carboxypeptidase